MILITHLVLAIGQLSRASSSSHPRAGTWFCLCKQSDTRSETACFDPKHVELYYSVPSGVQYILRIYAPAIMLLYIRHSHALCLTF